MKVPVLFIIYNRPEESKVVFEAIRAYQPTDFFISGDGAKDSDDAIRVENTRSIIDLIDWPCNLHLNFQNRNLGCKHGVITALNWFFNIVDQGIILEDDTIPSQEFFYFASVLLNRYKHDPRIMTISGHNPVSHNISLHSDYLFSNYSYSWGWASWRRAWQLFDASMTAWPALCTSKDTLQYPFNESRNKCFQAAFDGMDTWDYQWDLSILVNHGLRIVPRINLIKNIGFNNNATHTRYTRLSKFNTELYSGTFSGIINGPQTFLPNSAFETALLDYVALEQSCNSRSLPYRLLRHVLRLLKKRLPFTF